MKFNVYAVKCLSERQKRESGLNLTAPPLTLPHESERKARRDRSDSPGNYASHVTEEETKMAKKPKQGASQRIAQKRNSDFRGGKE
jgi:hypothetical protein